MIATPKSWPWCKPWISSCEENSGGCEALPDAVCLLSVGPKMGICRICICRVCRICLVFGQEKRRRRKEAYWEEKL